MLAILIGRFGQIILSILSVKLATSLLSPDVYGQISLFAALFLVFSLTFINPIGMFYNRNLHSWIKNGEIKFYLQIFLVYLILVAGVAASLGIAAGFFGVNIVKNINSLWVVIVLGSGIIFANVNLQFISFLNLLGKRISFVLLTFFTALMALIGSLVLIYGFMPKAEYWQLGQMLGQAVVGIIAGYLLFKCIKHAPQVNGNLQLNYKKIVSFAVPVGLAVGLAWVQTQSYPFVIGSKIGLTALGLFYAGYNIGSVIIITFETVVTSYFLPSFYQGVAVAEPSQYPYVWKKYANAILPPLFLTMIFIIIFSPELTRILLGDKFQLAAKYVMWGALAEAGRVVVSTLAYFAHANLNTKALIIPNALGALFSLLLMFLFIPVLGVNAVGIALVLANIVVAIVMHYTCKQNLIGILLSKKLGKALFYAALILLIAGISKRFFPSPMSLVGSIAIIIIFGLIYFAFAYQLFYESIKHEKTL